ncbi:MAG: VirB4 family type IV secretion system protein, partial [Thermomicrobiales bacterium]
MRRGAVADLLPVLAVEEGHFITVDGRIGTALACTGINLSIQSDAAAATVAALFAETLTYLPLGAHLELLVTNSPLRADEWVPRHRAQFHPPVGLATYVDHIASAYREELGGQHIPDLRFYAVLSLPGAREGRRRGTKRTLRMDRAAHRETLAALIQAASELAHALAELDVIATPVARQGMLDLLWQCANPTWSQDVVAPYREASPADVRTLRDRLGQSRLLRRADSLNLDRGYETTMALRALPDGTFPGWLRSLMATGVAFRFALHIEALSKEKERQSLSRTLRQRHAVLAERRYQGSSPDIEQEEAYGEAQDLLRAMATTDLRTFRTAIFITVRAGTSNDLSAAARAVGKALGDAGGTAIDRCHLYQDVVWRATLPLAHNPAGMAYRTVTTNLADTLPFLHHRAGTHGGPLIGFSHPGHEVVTLDMYDPSLDNSNLTCLGISGSGKTMFAQSFALKHIARGGRVIVLDRSTGHWDDLTAAVPGAVVHRVLLDSGFRINPWELPRHAGEPSQTKLEYLLDLHTLLVGELHGGVPALTAQERALLEGACRAVYREERLPNERHLFDWLRRAEREDVGADADPVRRQQYRALAERLMPYVHGGTYAGLLDGPTTVRPDALLEVFNFKGLADRLVPLAMLPLIEYIWSVIADPTRPTLVVLDEGWSLLNNPASARFVAEATRTGRHHGIITLNLSQMVTDYEGPLGQAVIDNASVSLLLAQSDHALPQVQSVFHLSADERAMVGRLRTVRQVRAGAYLHSRRGADSGEISLYVT